MKHKKTKTLKIKILNIMNQNYFHPTVPSVCCSTFELLQFFHSFLLIQDVFDV